MNTEITQTTNFLNNKIKTRNYIKSALVLSAILLGCLSVKSQTVETFNYTGAIQTYTVPAGVTSIEVDVYGAQGGSGGGYYAINSVGPGGSGARMKGDISVTPGEVLTILVGQQGGSNGGPHGNENGGGGGSFVVRQSGNVPAVIAGGGGGSPSLNYGIRGLGCTRSIVGAHGQITTSGSSVNCITFSAGGVGGNGGNSTGNNVGGGGGGFFSNGGGGGGHCNPSSGGKSFLSGGASVFGGSCYSNDNYGGYGGGGEGALGGPGAGGGYSGGATAGRWSSYSTYGGGGGSYNIGTNQTNTSGVRSGNGLVTITFLCEGVVGTSIILNSNDNGPGSLRDLVSGSCRNDTLVFDTSTNGHPIVLSSGQIILHKDIVITGIDSASTIIDGGDLGRIFNIAPGVTVTLTGVKLQNGKAKEGGAIYNAGNLTLNTVLLTNNKAKISNLGHTNGGAIYNKGQMTITNSSLISNSATSAENSHSYGGAIYNVGSCVMSNSEANGNSVESFHGLVLGGAIYNGNKSNFDLSNSSMSGNSATSEYYGFGGAIVNRRHVTSTINGSSFNDNTSTTDSDKEIFDILSPNSITIIP